MRIGARPNWAEVKQFIVGSYRRARSGLNIIDVIFREVARTTFPSSATVSTAAPASVGVTSKPLPAARTTRA
jgi:hypothetical protein